MGKKTVRKQLYLVIKDTITHTIKESTFVIIMQRFHSDVSADA